MNKWHVTIEPHDPTVVVLRDGNPVSWPRRITVSGPADEDAAATAACAALGVNSKQVTCDCERIKPQHV